MKYPLIYLSLLIFFSSSTCSYLSNKEKRITFPVIVDTFNLIPTQTHAKIDYLKRANYYPYYLGGLTDTLLINYNIGAPPPVPPPPPSLGLYYLLIPEIKKPTADPILPGMRMYWDFYVDPEWSKPEKATKHNLHIHIDTTKTVLNLHPRKKIKIDKSYPILLYNTSIKDTVKIGEDYHINLILEAQNKAGEWQAIERPFVYSCGHVLGYIILPPQNAALTSAIIFEGDFETQLRLKMDSLYSSTFRGRIDVGQFKRKNVY